MDSPQSVISPHKNSAEKPNQTKPNGNQTLSNHNNSKDKTFIGALNVYIHSARDILNICIYHKQDVYAKLSLTDDPENSVNSNIINGGGQNPVFNDQVNLKVAKIDSTSLKCEIWMMSRVKNYLEDQLLGFALVPLSEILLNDGKLEKEFTLSSTDLFHSPAGFVQLSIEYSGAKPSVVITDLTVGNDCEDSEISEASPPSDLEKIEFPDPKIVNEDEIMVSEYLGNPCTSLETQESSVETVEAHPNKVDSPPSVANGGSLSTSDWSEETKEKSNNNNSNDDIENSNKDSEGESPLAPAPAVEAKKPVVANVVNIEPKEDKIIVQQDFVDMYNKSMQQFTESLAKMKLPLDIADTTGAKTSSPATATSSAENLGSDPKAQTPKSNRVFYGSRAFF